MITFVNRVRGSTAITIDLNHAFDRLNFAIGSNINMFRIYTAQRGVVQGVGSSAVIFMSLQGTGELRGDQLHEPEVEVESSEDSII